MKEPKNIPPPSFSPNAMPVTVDIHDLHYHYDDGTAALKGVNFQIAAGEHVGLIGPNGAGKSTLLLHLNGILPDPSCGLGNVRIGGMPLAAENLASIRRQVGLIFQDADDQLFCPTVFDDVAFGPRQFGWPVNQIDFVVRGALSEVGLDGFEDRAPHRLSGGEKRRACLAGVLACGPGVLALDEPTSGLDPRGRRELIALLRGLNATMLIASHDLELVLELCSRVFVLDGGRIVAAGPTLKILSDEPLMLAHGLERPASLNARPTSETLSPQNLKMASISKDGMTANPTANIIGPMLHNTTQQKLDQLRATMCNWGSVLVAYSGGVDSALVMAVAHEELGAKSLACIGVSPSYPTREMRDAVELAEKLNVPYRLVQTAEHLNSSYAANPSNRCYFCKSELHDQLHAIAEGEGWAVVADGNNASDLGDDRPGMTAAKERGVRSPLLELGITKADVRAIAKHLQLPVWDKPAMACLSSRVPHGTAITPELLRQIESAEDSLVALGFRQFRVRHHGDLARIEVLPDDLPKALEHREQLMADIKKAGYKYVTLDLTGFRTEVLHTLNIKVGSQKV